MRADSVVVDYDSEMARIISEFEEDMKDNISVMYLQQHQTSEN